MRRVKKIYPLVLAGGKSTRMGVDKKFLKLHERTLIENAVLVAKNFLSESYSKTKNLNIEREFSELVGKILISVESDQISKDSLFRSLKKELIDGENIELEVIPDFLKEVGPLGGIYSVCDHLLKSNSEWTATSAGIESLEYFCFLMVFPVDMPRIFPQDFMRLIEEVVQISPVQNFIVRYQNLELPFVLGWSLQSNPVKEFFRVSSKRSISEFQKNIGVREIPLSAEQVERQILTNLNFPDEFRREAESGSWAVIERRMPLECPMTPTGK